MKTATLWRRIIFWIGYCGMLTACSSEETSQGTTGAQGGNGHSCVINTPCQSNLDCPDGHGCNWGVNPPKCQLLYSGTEGCFCYPDSDPGNGISTLCDSTKGLWCAGKPNGGTETSYCATYPWSEGTPCGSTQDCQSGLTCILKRNTCGIPKTGDSCENARDCGSGGSPTGEALECLWIGETKRACGPKRQESESCCLNCTSSFHCKCLDCASGLFCLRMSDASGGVCTKPPLSQGDKCERFCKNESGFCAEPQTCRCTDSQMTGPPVCAPAAQTGTKCFQDSDCQSGNCTGVGEKTAGTCSP